MKVIADTGPLVAAANRRDEAHELAAALVIEIGRDLVIPSMVLVETDYLLRTRVGVRSARSRLRAVAAGEHTIAYMTPALLRRAVEIDVRFDDLDLGLTEGAVWPSPSGSRLPCSRSTSKTSEQLPQMLAPGNS